MEGDSMPLCSRCPKHPEMTLRGSRFVCPDCGWGYDKPVHIRTYPELLADERKLVLENEKLKRKISELEKRIEELTQNSLETPPNQQQTLLSPRLV